MSIEFFHQPKTINEQYLVLGVLEVKKDSIIYFVKGGKDLSAKLTVEEFKQENFSKIKWKKLELEMTLLEKNLGALSSICNVVGVTIGPKTIFLTKRYEPEYVTLEEYMQSQKPLTWLQVIDIVGSACDKLEILHGYMDKMIPGVVHQSLSPRSFLIDATKMRYKNEVDILVQEGFIYQSPDPYYSAPEEKISEDASLNKEIGCSIYSMGLIIFRMLTGKNLWEALSYDSMQKKYNLSFKKDFIEELWKERVVKDTPKTLLNSLFWGAQESEGIFNLDAQARVTFFPSLSRVCETLKNIQEGDVDVPLFDWALQAKKIERDAISILIARYLQEQCVSKKYANIKVSPYSIYVNQKSISKVLSRRDPNDRLFSSLSANRLGKIFTIKDQSSQEQDVYVSLAQLQKLHSYENILYSFSLLLGFLITNEPFGLEVENHRERKQAEEYDFEKISGSNEVSDWERVFRRGLGIPLEGDAYQYTDLIEFVMDLSKGLPPIGLVSLRQYRKLGHFKPQTSLQLAEYFSVKDNTPSRGTPDSIFIKTTDKGIEVSCEERYIDSRHEGILISNTMSDVYRTAIVGLWGIFGDELFKPGVELKPNLREMFDKKDQVPPYPSWLIEIFIVSVAPKPPFRWRSTDDFWARIKGDAVKKYCGDKSVRDYWKDIDKRVQSRKLDEHTNIAREHLGWATKGQYGLPVEYKMPVSERMTRLARRFMPFIVLLALALIGMIVYPFVVPTIPTLSSSDPDEMSKEIVKDLKEMSKEEQVWYCRGLARGNLITTQESLPFAASPLEHCMKAAALSKNSDDFVYWFKWYPLAVENERVSLPDFWKNTFGEFCSTKTKVTNCNDKNQRCIYVRESIKQNKLIKLPKNCDEEHFLIATKYLEEL